jgi:3-methyladenine DNA glycosylase/8-oxoguanine DNA glycosylase
MVSLRPCRLSDPADCAELVELAVTEFGRIDVLFTPLSDRGSRPARRSALRRSCAAPGRAARLRIRHLPIEDTMVRVAERWHPYRSLAVSYLFASEFEKGS